MCKAMDEIRKDNQKRNDMKKDVLHIRDVVAGPGISVEKAMDVIHFPMEQRSDVAYLVQLNDSGIHSPAPWSVIPRRSGDVIELLEPWVPHRN